MKKIKVKIISILTSILILLQIIIPTTQIFAEDLVSITFKDENLYNKINTSLASKISNKDDNTLTIYMTQERIDAVTALSLEASNIEDVTGIEKFKNLKSLDLVKNKITDISSLSSLTNLERLFLGQADYIYSDGITPTSQYPGWNNIKNIDGLENLTNLKILALGDNEIEEIEALEELVNLEELYLANNKIKNIDALENLTNLQTLQLRGNQIVSISALKNLTNLKSLELSENNIYDFSDLSNLVNLEKLNIGSQESPIKDGNVNFLSKLINLSALNIRNNGITDITAIKDLINLKSLMLGGGSYTYKSDGSYWNYGNGWTTTDSSGFSYTVRIDESNNITDIEPIKNLSNLELLFMDSIGIEDISNISECSNLKYVSIKFNNISDLTPVINLNNLKSIFADKNNIKCIDGIDSITNLCMLSLVENKIEDISEIENLTNTVCKLQKQNITKNIEDERNIQLPDIFIKAKDENSKLYTEEEFILENCTLSDDGKYVIIDEGRNEATVQIYKGSAHGSVLTLTQLDTTPPELSASYSINEITNQDVTVTITSNEQVQAVEGWTLSNDKLSQSKTYTQNSTEEITVLDLAGNSSNINISVNNIDKIAPQVEVSYSTTLPTNNDVIVTITSNEELQDVNGWTLSSDNKKLTKTYAANTTEQITVYDIAGNDANIRINVDNIDKIVPLAEVNYSITEITNEDVIVTITANERIRELEGWTLSEDRLKLIKTYMSNAKEELTIYDLAGNNTKIEVNINNIDKIRPTIEVSYSTTQITNEDVTVTVKANKEIQEVEGWTLSENKKVLTKIFKENGEEELTVYDTTGNNSQKTTIKVTNIDKIKPEANVKYNITEITNEDVIATIIANERIQEVEGWSLSEDEKILSKVYKLNREERVTVLDLAGNDIKVDVKVDNIDKISPEATVEYSTTKITNEDVTVTITSNEQVQQVEGWILSNDKLSLSKTYIQNSTEEVTIYDLAGNSTKVKISVSNIDKTQSIEELPDTGVRTMMILAIGLIIISVIVYKKNKDLNDIR